MKLVSFLILSLIFLCGFSVGRLSKRAVAPIPAPEAGNACTMEYRPGPEARKEKLSFTF